MERVWVITMMRRSTGVRRKIRTGWGRSLLDRHNVTGVRHARPESAAAGAGYTLLVGNILPLSAGWSYSTEYNYS